MDCFLSRLKPSRSGLERVSINWPQLERQLRRILPGKAVVAARQELLAYDCDGLTLDRHQPPLVVLPETTEDVAAVLRLCHQSGVPFVARGSGTGLSGGAVAETEALVIATSRMRRVLALDLENRRITVQPGVINSWVTRAVAGDGFYYAPDPSSQVACSIGGNIAENSGGVHCLKYGVTSNHVLSMEVVLPDGSVMTLGGELDEAPELDLRGAFIGSEGTLGHRHRHYLAAVAQPPERGRAPGRLHLHGGGRRRRAAGDGGRCLARRHGNDGPLLH